MRKTFSRHFLRSATMLFSYSFFSIAIFGQTNSDLKMDNYHPVTPAAFEFTKYVDMPVSEYTGVPNISVPLYNINLGQLDFPIALTYHAGGIRVSQEASWVGLGWDLSFGAITQEINDRDDFDPTTVRVKPDFIERPYPSLYISAGHNSVTSNGFVGMNPQVYEPESFFEAKPLYSFPIFESYTNLDIQTSPLSNWYVIPINGNRNDQPKASYIVDAETYDTEPDIFTASFLGNTLKFIRDSSNSNQMIVLNKKGFLVSKIENGFLITSPSGDKFHFTYAISSSSYSRGGYTRTGTGDAGLNISSRVFYLNKIETIAGRVLSINWSKTADARNIPVVSDKYEVTMGSNTTWHSTVYPPYEGLQGVMPQNGQGTVRSRIYSFEPRVYPTSISFPEGSVRFLTSVREDLLEGRKLDQIEIVSDRRVVHKFAFGYSYQNSQAVGGNVIVPDTLSYYQEVATKRLQLNVIDGIGGGRHSFEYGEVSLPSKLSLAQDFWGFYNGALTNQSLVPNPVRLDQNQLNVASLSSFGYLTADNGNNNAARLSFCQAGTLRKIIYPTGGTIEFTYELNRFDSYILPDSSGVNSSFTTGNGLRIREIKWKNALTIEKSMIYDYAMGKSTMPIKVSRFYSGVAHNCGGAGVNLNVQTTTFNVLQLNGKGFFSSNGLTSGDFVGYKHVTQRQVNRDGVSLGRVETDFAHDLFDVAYGGSYGMFTADLPSKKRLLAFNRVTNSGLGTTSSVENGKTLQTRTYDSQGGLKMKSVFIYSPISPVSRIYYGVRIFGYLKKAIYHSISRSDQDRYWVYLPKVLGGYYPIYDFETLLQSKVDSVYEDGVLSTTSTTYQYDEFNRPTQITTLDAQGTSEKVEQVFPTLSGSFVANQLFNDNRLDELLSKRISIREKDSIDKVVRTYTRDFGLFGSRLFLSKQSEVVHPRSTPFQNQSNSIDLLQYSEFGRLQEFKKSGLANAMIWGYNMQYPVAEIIGASYGNCAYSSFESESKGGFNYSGVTVLESNAPTGNLSYMLNTGPVSRSLNSNVSYILSFWATGTVSISGNPTLRVGQSYRGYTYYEVTIANANSVELSGNCRIDEVRLFPVGAQMTTYCYEPLVGMSASCDPTNRIVYYEYDEVGRLAIVRDQEKNILKKNCYKLFDGTESCNYVYNELQNVLVVKTDCPPNSNTAQVNFPIPAGLVLATTLSKANELARDLGLRYASTAYANLYGSCTIYKPTITSFENTIARTIKLNFIPITGCERIEISCIYIDNNNQALAIQAGSCVSPSTYNVPASGKTYRFTIKCFSAQYPNGVVSDPYDVFCTN